MNIVLDDEKMKAMLSEAIFLSLDVEKRDVLLKGALKYLITPDSTGYSGKKQSPLQAAFEHAVSNVATRVAEQFMAEPEMQAKIRELMTEATIKVFETDRTIMIAKVANAIAQGFVADRER